jgi:PAS domain S-box-containing protein
MVARPKLSMEALLRALQDHAICSLSRDGNICDWTEGAENLTGYSVEDVAGRHFSMLYRPQDCSAGVPALAIDRAASIEEHRDEGWRRHKDGSEFWAANRLHALRDEFGALAGFVSVTTDLSHEKEREAQLLRARQTAEESAQAKSEFLASMSHELRTPLNAISGFAQLLQIGSETLTERQTTYVDMILESGVFLLRLINDILDLASIEAGGVKTVDETVNLSEAVELAAKLLESDAEANHIELDTSKSPRHLNVRGDSARILQVLTNLISNSIKYSDKGGKVSIACYALADGKTIVKVSDTGIGIASEHIGELFKPFNRLGREGGPVQGTGIGLATCRKLIALMNGEIGAESTEGQGSTFWFILPSAAPSRGRIATSGEMKISAQPREKRVVLCVEDNWANAKVLLGALGSIDHLVVEIAETGAAGLARAKSLAADLIIVDLHLPDMSGFDVLKALRADAATARIAAFALTADALPRTRERAEEAGFDLFLTKPCRIDELLNAVAETLGGRS